MSSSLLNNSTTSESSFWRLTFPWVEMLELSHRLDIKQVPKILVLHGSNLDFLGSRFLYFIFLNRVHHTRSPQNILIMKSFKWPPPEYTRFLTISHTIFTQLFSTVIFLTDQLGKFSFWGSCHLRTWRYSIVYTISDSSVCIFFV